MYEIDFTKTALDDLRFFRKFEQNLILNVIDQRLTYDPTVETGNRFRHDSAEISEWELRVGEFRVYYLIRLKSGKSYELYRGQWT